MPVTTFFKDCTAPTPKGEVCNTMGEKPTFPIPQENAGTAGPNSAVEVAPQTLYHGPGEKQDTQTKVVPGAPRS